jgi:hypothetical protein
MEANASQPVPTISLVGHVTDEYGLPPGTARDLCRYGRISVGDSADSLKPATFDDPELVPIEEIEGKTVRIEHEQRTVQFIYRQPLEQRLG